MFRQSWTHTFIARVIEVISAIIALSGLLIGIGLTFGSILNQYGLQTWGGLGLTLIGTIAGVFAFHLHENIELDRWKFTIFFSIIEGLSIIVALASFSIGLGFILIGIMKLSGEHALGGFLLVVIGIIGGIFVYYLHKRIKDENINFFYKSTLNSGYNSHKSSQENIDSDEDLIINLVRQFKPSWRNRNGNIQLEGGEIGNNAMLAQYLRDNSVDEVETEVVLRNGSRVDIVINNQIILECKKNLGSTAELHNLSGEIKRIKNISQHRVYAVIYGYTRTDLLYELTVNIGANNVIALGQ